MWITWLRVAIERAKKAREVRDEMASRHARGENVSALLNDEFEASIVAVAASAHALDALYGSTVIRQSVRDQWRHSTSKREGHIREALKRVFDTGKVNHMWVQKFGWLSNGETSQPTLLTAPSLPSRTLSSVTPHPNTSRTLPSRPNVQPDLPCRCSAGAPIIHVGISRML